MSPHALAKMLKPFGIKSERSRAGTPNPVSVYTRRSFESAWERYLPSPGPDVPIPTGTSDTDSDSVPDVSDETTDLALPGMDVDGEDGDRTSRTGMPENESGLNSAAVPVPGSPSLSLQFSSPRGPQESIRIGSPPLTRSVSGLEL